MSDQPPRDPRVNPVPGDEVASPGRLKAKIVEITVGESGTTEVKYKVGYHGGEYFDTVVSASIQRWRRFAERATEVSK